MDQTEEIFKNLYKVFSQYPKPDRVFGSPISVNEGDDLPLVSKHLKYLTYEDFGSYPFKSMSTWGTEENFMYFLPRMLELSFYGFGLLDGSIFFSKILSAGWEDWNSEQKEAFDSYLRAMWNDATQYPYLDSFRLKTLIDNLSYFIDDLDELVYAWAKRWIEAEDEETFEKLVAYLDRNWVDVFFKNKPHYAFLDAILESSLHERLESAFFKYEKSKPQFATQLSRCEEKLSYYLANFT